MKKAVQDLVGVIHQLDDGVISFNTAQMRVRNLFRDKETAFNEGLFSLAFPIFSDYFFDPVKKASAVLQERKLSKDELLIAHRFIRESKLAKMMFLSSWYPRSLLVKSAVNLLDFARQNPQYLPKIINGELTGPMMLEIHPTNGKCIYKCRMCIWCGGQENTFSIADFYGANQLLTTETWSRILDETKQLGTKQIIFSGGGETLLSQSKIKAALDKANSIGLDSMIYTNGRTLCDANPTLLNSILNSNWLRISLHAATPEIYSKLTNRPLKSNDLEFVLSGIKKVISLKKKQDKNLKVGLGIVLQELNYAEIPGISKLGSELEIDFLDIRVDCIGVTKKLSAHQHEQMLNDLRHLRDGIEDSKTGLQVSFADDLLLAMDQWEKMKLTQPKRCLIPAVRPAIDPFGIVGACDSIGEPYTRSKSPEEYVLGQISEKYGFTDIMRDSSDKKFSIRCKFCMPGQISLNALLEKLIDDLKIDIGPEDQPFSFNA